MLSLPTELLLHVVAMHFRAAGMHSLVTVGRMLTTCTTVRDSAEALWQKMAELFVLPLQPLLANVPDFNLNTVQSIARELRAVHGGALNFLLAVSAKQTRMQTWAMLVRAQSTILFYVFKLVVRQAFDGAARVLRLENAPQRAGSPNQPTSSVGQMASRFGQKICRASALIHASMCSSYATMVWWWCCAKREYLASTQRRCIKSRGE